MGKVLIFTIILALIAVGLTIFKQTSKNLTPTKSTTSTLSPSTTIESNAAQVNIPKTQVIATNLEVPWAVAFLPDKSILLTERAGKVRLIDSNGQLLPNPIHLINVKQTGESGLHGVTVHPQFSSNHFVYFYYTYSGSGDNTLNKVVRFKYENQTLSFERTF